MGLFDWLLGPRQDRARSLPHAPGKGSFLAVLAVQDRAPLARADFEAVAMRLNCEWEALAAAVEADANAVRAFEPDGRIAIQFERHLFSRKTQGRFDASHPELSSWAPNPVAARQTEQWAQLTAAYALDAEAALQSTRFGRHLLLGQDFGQLGLKSAGDYVAKLARSERDQLEAFEGLLRETGLAEELQRKDWVGFASRYKGPSYAIDGYDEKLSQAYQRLKSNRAA